MTALARTAEPAAATPARSRAWIPLFPTLWPSMIRPGTAAPMPFPFTDPGRRAFTFARYGIFAIAQALGLRGREVLFPAFFHCVELDALLAAGARIKFFHVGRDLQIDPDDIGRRVTSQTAALYVIHYAGFPAPIRDLRQLCQERGLALIEDCAHALLSSTAGEPLGSFGHGAVFSLPKSLPTPDGGVALMSNGWANIPDPRERPAHSWVAAHALSLMLSNLEMRKLPAAAPARSIGLRIGKAAFRASGRDYVPMGTPDFDLTQANTNISRLSQRILARQDFAAIATRRRANYAYLLARLQDIAPPIFGELPVGVCPLFYPFRSDRREALFGALRDQGVEIGEFWPDNHFYGPNGEFPDADVLRRTALWLPCHQDLGAEALDSLVDAVRRAVAGVS